MITYIFYFVPYIPLGHGKFPALMSNVWCWPRNDGSCGANRSVPSDPCQNRSPLHECDMFIHHKNSAWGVGFSTTHLSGKIGLWQANKKSWILVISEVIADSISLYLIPWKRPFGDLLASSAHEVFILERDLFMCVIGLITAKCLITLASEKMQDRCEKESYIFSKKLLAMIL